MKKRSIQCYDGDGIKPSKHRLIADHPLCTVFNLECVNAKVEQHQPSWGFICNITFLNDREVSANANELLIHEKTLVQINLRWTTSFSTPATMSLRGILIGVTLDDSCGVTLSIGHPRNMKAAVS